MRIRRGLLLVAALVAGLLSLPSSGASADDGDTAEDAARQIAEARDDANAAAGEFWEAQARLEEVQADKDALDAQTAELEKQAAALRKVVENLVINRYVGSASTGIDLLSGTVGPTEQAQTQVLVGIIDDTSSVSLDDYDALLSDLERSREKAQAAADELLAAQSDYKAKEQHAKDEIARLKLVEKDRLQEEAVQKALEARRQRAAEAAQKAAAEQQRIDQAAAAKKAADDAAARVAAEVAAEGGGADGGDDARTVVPKTNSDNEASGTDIGGTTGGGGTGNRPVGALPPQIYGAGDAWVCPVPEGTTAFSDTFGAPRSGGRTHEGVDMIGPKGTPIIAVVDGMATPRTNTLGGITVSFDGDDGNHYYYAHLDGYATLGKVAKGTVIGFLGQTGNARFSVAHLHFEIHPDGGDAVDPTPTIIANC